MESSLIYQTHCDLYKHYSSKIFFARVSIITVIVGTWLISIGAIKDIESKVLASGAVNYMGSLLVLVLWLLEMGYFWKFSVLTGTLRTIERSDQRTDTFFVQYRTLTHRAVYLFYLVAIAYFLIIDPQARCYSLANWYRPVILGIPFLLVLAALNRVATRSGYRHFIGFIAVLMFGEAFLNWLWTSFPPVKRVLRRCGNPAVPPKQLYGRPE